MCFQRYKAYPDRAEKETPAKIRLNPTDHFCIRPHLPSAEDESQDFRTEHSSVRLVVGPSHLRLSCRSIASLLQMLMSSQAIPIGSLLLRREDMSRTCKIQQNPKGYLNLRWPDPRKSGAISGFPNRTPSLRIAFRGTKTANRRFEAIRTNRSNVMRIESIRANRPDSRCESPDHLRSRRMVFIPLCAFGPTTAVH